MIRANLFLYFLSLLILALAVWSYLTPVDIAVRSRGIVRPSHEVVKVAAEVSGLISRINLRESLRVNRGDILLSLDPASLALRLQSLRSQIHFSELRLAELDARIASLGALNSTSVVLDSNDLNAAVAAAQATLTQARSRLARNTELFSSGIASRQSLDESRSDLARAEADAARLNPSSLELKRAQAEARLQDLASERTPLLASIAAAYKELEQTQLDLGRLTITAPVSGHVTAASTLHAGEFIAAGAAVATILPDSEPLIVESWLSSSDRAFVSPGQSVRLRLESSSITLSKIFSGSVVSISPDVRVNDSGLPAYRVVISYSPPEADEAPPGAEVVRLGTSLEVHFITRHERLLFLLFQNIRREFREAF